MAGTMTTTVMTVPGSISMETSETTVTMTIIETHDIGTHIGTMIENHMDHIGTMTHTGIGTPTMMTKILYMTTIAMMMIMTEITQRTEETGTFYMYSFLIICGL